MGWLDVAWPRISIRKVDQHPHFEPLEGCWDKVRGTKHSLCLSCPSTFKVSVYKPQLRRYSNAPEIQTMLSNIAKY